MRRTERRDRRGWLALQGKSHLYIPFLGVARPQLQFLHSCVCERFILYIPRIGPHISLEQNRQTSPGNIYITHRYMSVGTGRQNILILFWKKLFHFWEYINGNYTFILDSHLPFICSVDLQKDERTGRRDSPFLTYHRSPFLAYPRPPLHSLPHQRLEGPATGRPEGSEGDSQRLRGSHKTVADIVDGIK